MWPAILRDVAMLSLRDALESALVENPDDLATHYAYADYLQEQGDPRGEFIQLQLALEDRQRSEAERRNCRLASRELSRSINASGWAACRRFAAATGACGGPFTGRTRIPNTTSRGLARLPLSYATPRISCTVPTWDRYCAWRRRRACCASWSWSMMMAWLKRCWPHLTCPMCACFSWASRSVASTIHRWSWNRHYYPN